MKIKQITNDNKLLHHIHLFDENISCKIFPNLGASLQELIYNNVAIIDGISINDSGIEDYRNTYKSSILFPFPNRVQDGIYVFNQEAHQLIINEKPLNNALHGLVFDKKFELEKSEAKDTEASITLSYTSNGQLIGFPYRFKFSVTYILNSSGELLVSFSAENLDDKSFPFGFGWHPYFVSPTLEKSSLSFKGKDQFINSNRNIPIEYVPAKLPDTFLVKDRFFDDAFSMETAKLKFEDKKYTIELDFDNNTESYLQIYTPPQRKNIAIEPMTCPADSFNNKHGLKILTPKEIYTWKIDLKLTTL